MLTPLPAELCRRGHEFIEIQVEAELVNAAMAATAVATATAMAATAVATAIATAATAANERVHDIIFNRMRRGRRGGDATATAAECQATVMSSAFGTTATVDAESFAGPIRRCPPQPFFNLVVFFSLAAFEAAGAAVARTTEARDARRVIVAFKHRSLDHDADHGWLWIS